MTNHQDVCRRWVDHVTGKTTRKLLRGTRIFADRNTIYSYGYHFPLAIALHDKKKQVALFLLNGDRYSVSTAQHQSHIRSAVQGSDVPHVIIPFSALSAAGISHDSIELIHAEPSRSENIPHSTRVQPEGSVWITSPVSEYVRKSDEEIAEILAKRNKVRVDYYPEDKRVLTADDLQHYETHSYQQTGEQTQLFSAARGGHLINVTEDEQGTLYSWVTYRHWLGESLIRAEVGSSRRIKCKTCKGSGRAAEGWEDVNIGGGLSFHCKPCGGRGGRAVFSTRKAFFLSGFDRNEPRPSYFFCELPKGVDVTSVDEALEALKPPTVVLAEQNGREVKRQGDIFAVPVSSDRKALRAAGAVFTKSANLLGTNHEATEVAVLPNGTVLAQGFLRHKPAHRRPDHRRVTLGKNEWHIIVKNTVPTTK